MPAATHMEADAVDAEYLCENELNPANDPTEPTQRKRVEYWSKTYRMWIPAEITAVDHKTCAVQVNVKPGVWLSSSDWDKKLRVAVYLCSSNANDEDQMEIPQKLNDNIDKPPLQEAIGEECENMTNPHFNEMYPNQISSSLHSQGMDHEQKSRVLGAKTESSDDSDVLESDAISRCRTTLFAEAREEHAQQMPDGEALQEGSPVLPVEAREEAQLPEDETLQEGFPVPTAEPSKCAVTEQADLESAASPASWIPSSTAAEIPAVTYVAATSMGTSGAIHSEGRFAGYRCPTCGEGGLECIQDALDHCGKSGLRGAIPVSRTGMAAIDEPQSSPLSPAGSVGPSQGQGAVEPERAASDGKAAGNQAQEAEGEAVSIFSRPSWTARESTSDGQTASAAEPEECPAPVRSSSSSQCVGADEKAVELGEEGYKKPKTRILGYCCPKCGQGQLTTLQDAVQHCRKPEDAPTTMREVHPEDAVQGEAAAEALPAAPAPSSWVTSTQAEARAPVAALPGEPVAYNSYGQPIIARQVDPDSGGRTMVLNDDGSCDVFGKQTIASLLSSTETEADGWMEVLNDYQLRGLVHEMGQRLLESSHIYQARLSQWEQLSERANLEFFGLSSGATDRELDVAYRQLSKKMHPDKNGGTEESKKRFQEMKTRYEALKKKRAEGGKEGEPEKEEQPDEQDEEQSKEKDDRTIEFDPTSRNSLNETAKKMLSQLGTLGTSMENLVRQLKRHGL